MIIEPGQSTDPLARASVNLHSKDVTYAELKELLRAAQNNNWMVVGPLVMFTIYEWVVHPLLDACQAELGTQYAVTMHNVTSDTQQRVFNRALSVMKQLEWLTRLCRTDVATGTCIVHLWTPSPSDVSFYGQTVIEWRLVQGSNGNDIPTINGTLNDKRNIMNGGLLLDYRTDEASIHT